MRIDRKYRAVKFGFLQEALLLNNNIGIMYVQNNQPTL